MLTLVRSAFCVLALVRGAFCATVRGAVERSGFAGGGARGRFSTLLVLSVCGGSGAVERSVLLRSALLVLSVVRRFCDRWGGRRFGFG